MSIIRLSLRRQITIPTAAAVAGLAVACTDTTAPSTAAPTAPPGSARPALALGTNTIVFQRDSAGQGSIYTMNDDGTNLTRLVAGAQPAWSPDHSQIVFVDKITVFIMNADGSGVRPLTGVSGDLFPSFTADGSKVLFTHRTPKGDADVLTINVDGTNRQTLLRLGGAAIEAPRMSPDGTKLAFQATRRTDSDIVVVDLATGRRTVVADSSFRETVPAWSPDSKRLAYKTGMLNAGRCIAVVNVDGSGRKFFTNDVGFCSTVSWSPDGKELAFTSTTDAAGVYRAPVDVAATPVRLTLPSGGASDQKLSWTR